MITHLQDDKSPFTAPVSPVISCKRPAPARGSPTIVRAVPLFTYQPVVGELAREQRSDPRTAGKTPRQRQNSARMSTLAAKTTIVYAATNTVTHAPQRTNERTRERPLHEGRRLLMRSARPGGRCATTPTANLLVSRPAMSHSPALTTHLGRLLPQQLTVINSDDAPTASRVRVSSVDD